MITYLLKVNAAAILLYGIYYLFLSNTTFHKLNRYYLLFIILFSLVCPFISFFPVYSPLHLNNNIWINNFNEYPHASLPGQVSESAGIHFNWIQIMEYVYLAGLILFFYQFVRNLFRLIILRSRSRKYSEGNLHIIRTDRFNASFSFFHWIFIPEGYSEISDLEHIKEHELVHARQLHSVDLIIAEIFHILCWFNPLVILLKKSLKSVHEFLADEAVISNKTSAADYLRLLVTSAEKSCISGITNHFKSSTIKNRIIMITKNKTSRLRKLTYILILPVLALLMQSFSADTLKNNPPEIRPVKGGKITSPFGILRKTPYLKKKTWHSGIDIAVPDGTPVVAPTDGIVLKAEERTDWGNLILIKHDDKYETYFAHMKDLSVKEGDHVTEGQVIGHAGSTGWSTGPHLHYEVIKNGKKVNPEDYFIK